ncbi:baculoviral IAP repeat-containing protein 7-B-like [Cydia pomonella]|uniref:baculoviral IAP repeat-containing protein 7-B-like n=1 Tax=Cydia pomonella TaxID=82600 RepID=UPI002ADDAF09|nr:baculoviral IAP repeat-containing protein 7-B-like [Cydia pomonella]
MPNSIVNSLRTRHPEYKREAVRRDTYSTWSVIFMNPDHLAAAGFFYTGFKDSVKCFECGIDISRWIEGDDAMTDHRRWSPICRFAKGEPCGNIPIDEDHIYVAVQSKRIIIDYSYYRRSTLKELDPTTPQGAIQCFGYHCSPQHKDYITEKIRQRTFTNWLGPPTLTPEKMAEAGFFYVRESDKTKCYHCGGGLSNWIPEDDPWIEHAHWFPKCYYVWSVRGPEFIELAANKITRLAEEGEPFEVPTPEENTETIENFQERETESGSVDNDIPRCRICCVEDLSIVMLPCKHMSSCNKCGPNLSLCPICRTPIRATVRARIA